MPLYAFPETLHTAPDYFETRFSDDRDIEMLGTFVAFRPLLTAPVCEKAMSLEAALTPLQPGGYRLRFIFTFSRQM